MKIFTGSYQNCLKGSLVSISLDKGKSANFTGNSYLNLAPKREFFKAWKNNTTLSEDENNAYYMHEFYKQVLQTLNPLQVLKELSEFGDNVVMLCYEKNDEFCHRHLVATWLEQSLHIEVPEIAVDCSDNILTLSREIKYTEQFKKIIASYK